MKLCTRLKSNHRVEQASETFEAVSEAHVFVSSDRTHDTYFVQHALTELKTHFAARGMKFNHWFINTDGAASHFKNRSRTAQLGAVALRITAGRFGGLRGFEFAVVSFVVADRPSAFIRLF